MDLQGIPALFFYSKVSYILRHYLITVFQEEKKKPLLYLICALILRHANFSGIKLWEQKVLLRKQSKLFNQSL